MELHRLDQKSIEGISGLRHRSKDRKAVLKSGVTMRKSEGCRSLKPTHRGKRRNPDEGDGTRIKGQLLLEQCYGSRLKPRPPSAGGVGVMGLGGDLEEMEIRASYEGTEVDGKSQMQESATPAAAQEIAELQEENMWLKQLSDRLTQRVLVLEKRLMGLGWSLD